VGLISQDAGRFSSATSGATSLTSALFPELSLQGEFQIPLGLYFSPFISYTPLPHKAADGGTSTTLLNVALRVEKKLGPALLRIGPGGLLYTISGSGGTTTLNNGTSTTVFALPDTTASSISYFLDVGAGATYSRFRLDLDAFLLDLASNRRAVNLLLGVSFGLL
jgi:hypothetical protein